MSSNHALTMGSRSEDLRDLVDELIGLLLEERHERWWILKMKND